jgi:hypothetical protein
MKRRRQTREEFLTRWQRRARAAKKPLDTMDENELRAEVARLRGERQGEHQGERQASAVKLVDRGKPIFQRRPARRPWK